MFVLIPIIIIAGLFIVFSFVPFIWRRPLWGPRRHMMYRPFFGHHRGMGHHPMGHHHRHW